jgi:hypothetical protein
MSDTLDIRDLIERFEELETEYDTLEDSDAIKNWADLGEYTALKDLLDALEGYGGDEQWRGEWYPITLIHENYFTEYSKDLVIDCGELPRDLPAYIEYNINWDGVAQDLKVDYSEVDYDGETYYYR